MCEWLRTTISKKKKVSRVQVLAFLFYFIFLSDGTHAAERDTYLLLGCRQQVGTHALGRDHAAQ